MALKESYRERQENELEVIQVCILLRNSVKYVFKNIAIVVFSVDFRKRCERFA